MHKSWDAPPFRLGLTPGPPVIGKLRNAVSMYTLMFRCNDYTAIRKFPRNTPVACVVHQR
jgi:hypothetical protein